MNLFKKIICFFLGTLFLGSCKEKYLPNLNLSVTSFLVVEGYINSGTGPTIITLTRTTKIVDTTNRVFERGAIVEILSETGTRIALSETGTGEYSVPQLTLNSNTRYCIHIKTKDCKEYQSDFSDVRKTPDIDSLSWKVKDGDVQTYVNTHDPNNKTKYYQWKYDEAWEFHSKFLTGLKLIYSPVSGRYIDAGYRDSTCFCADTTIAKCWKNNNLTAILIGSSEKLARDVISEQPTAFIPRNSQQLSVLYSINVKQYALSDKAYHFLQQMKRNTEQLGTIFDAQPSDNYGNIHCIGNEKEVVIGFVEITEEKQKRIFISNTQVPHWRYDPGCDPIVKVLNVADSIAANSRMEPIAIAEYGGNMPSGIKYLYFGDRLCTICTLTGVNKKPLFWP
jgi:hypothetical protein